MARIYPARRATAALSIDELRHLARRRLPEVVFEYLEGGAEDEVTLRRNRQVFDRLAFMPRALRDVGAVDCSTQIFGKPLALPLVIAPTGFSGLFSRHGDLSMARAAQAAGLPMGQSTVSNAKLEEIAAVPGLRHWMQLYVFRDRGFTEALVDRASAAGCEALILTVDANVFGNREWDKRNYASPTTPRLARRIEALRHPGWLREVMLPGVPGFGNLEAFLPEGQRDLNAAANWSRQQIDPSLSWRDVELIRKRWHGPLIVKGLLHVDDAVQAKAMGVDAVVLSNHGGRQLDGALAPLQLVAETRAAVGPEMVLMMDGGIRRGSDIAKAVALGATAVMAGRAPLYGLAAGGAAGAAHALTLLAGEYARVLALLGCRSTAELGPNHLRPTFD